MEALVSVPLPTIIYTPLFERTAKGLFTQDELRGIEDALATRPTQGAVIGEMGGARKTRIALPGMGKRGGSRVIYVHVPTKGRVYLLLAYGKGVQDDMTQDQKKAVAAVVAVLKGEP